MELSQIDHMLMTIIKEKKTIVGFLETVFQFLGKCTDFYYEMKTPNDAIGFPPGEAQKIVLDVLKKCKPHDLSGSLTPASHAKPDISDVAVEEIVCDSEDSRMVSGPSSGKPTKNKKNKDTDNKIVNNKKPEENFGPGEYCSGDVFKIFAWSQTLTDVEIYILVPDTVKNVKQLGVEIDYHSLRITDNVSHEVILEGEFYGYIKMESIVWSLDANHKLHISLDKRKEHWWRKLFNHHPDIDTSKIDCSRNIDELSEDSQVMIEKLRWNQEQKMLGKPTTDELDRIEMLKKAWDVEGSPFKGKPFDPTLVDFQN